MNPIAYLMWTVAFWVGGIFLLVFARPISLYWAAMGGAYGIFATFLLAISKKIEAIV